MRNYKRWTKDRRRMSADEKREHDQRLAREAYFRRRLLYLLKREVRLEAIRGNLR